MSRTKKDFRVFRGVNMHHIKRCSRGWAKCVDDTVAIVFDESLADKICAALNIKEARPTVRPKRAVQHRKVSICPKCKDKGIVR
jgi:hypothetical protein